MPRFEPMEFDETVILENERVKNMLKFSDTFTLVTGDVRIQVQKGRVKSVGKKITTRKRRK